ncbi:hypothetical protein SNE40_016634 [Patella caerulea]
MEGTSSKRDRESEGETPKPDTKSKKSGENDEEMDLHHKLDIFSKQMERLLSNQIDMKSNQESLRLSFETQLENLKTELIENMNSKIQILRDEISMDITAERLRIDGLVNTVDDLQAKMSTLECRVATSNHVNPLDNNDVTVVVFGLKFDDGEQIQQKAQQLINSLGHEITNSVTIQAASRLRPRKPNQNGLVKISFDSKEERDVVLRNKRKLGNSTTYKDVYLSRAKPLYERTMEANARTMARLFPD